MACIPFCDRNQHAEEENIMINCGGCGMCTPSVTRMKGLRTTPERALLMSKVRQHGTGPELAVRALLRDLGRPFRTNGKGLPGSPDIYSVGGKRALFVHGCFWHRHPGCRAATTPTRNRRFWLAKFLANVARDDHNIRRLRRLGYRVMTVWECQLKSPAKLVRLKRRLDRFFGVGT
jgi:DNA mismatch endonuclease (patch repair protein)